MTRKVFAAAVAACLAPVAAPAVEVSLYGGYRSEGVEFAAAAESPEIFCIVPPCASGRAESRGGESFGLEVDVPIDPRHFVEVLVGRQSTELRFGTNPGFPIVFPSGRGDADLDLTTAQIGVGRRWEQGSLAPFAAFTAGTTRVESDAFPLATLRPVDEDSFSASVAGGVRLAAQRRFGARVQARGHWIDLPSVLGGSTWQLELGTGLAWSARRR